MYPRQRRGKGESNKRKGEKHELSTCCPVVVSKDLRSYLDDTVKKRYVASAFYLVLREDYKTFVNSFKI